MQDRLFGFRLLLSPDRGSRLRLCGTCLRLRKSRRRHGEYERGYKEAFHFVSLRLLLPSNRHIPGLFPIITPRGPTRIRCSLEGKCKTPPEMLAGGASRHYRKPAGAFCVPAAQRMDIWN
jgi:hypothetical protein